MRGRRRGSGLRRRCRASRAGAVSWHEVGRHRPLALLHTLSLLAPARALDVLRAGGSGEGRFPTFARYAAQPARTGVRRARLARRRKRLIAAFARAARAVRPAFNARLARGRRGVGTAMLHAEPRALRVAELPRILGGEARQDVDPGAAYRVLLAWRGAPSGLGRAEALAAQAFATLERRPADGVRGKSAVQDVETLGRCGRDSEADPIAAGVELGARGLAAREGSLVDGDGLRTQGGAQRPYALARGRRAGGLFATLGALGARNPMDRVAVTRRERFGWQVVLRIHRLDLVGATGGAAARRRGDSCLRLGSAARSRGGRDLRLLGAACNETQQAQPHPTPSFHGWHANTRREVRFAPIRWRCDA